MKSNLLKLAIALFSLLLFALANLSFASTYTLVKIIDLYPLVGDYGSIEVDVVGNELYVANWEQDKYFRIDPITGSLLRSFSLGGGILIDNHGSEYNPTTGNILHASDKDAGGTLGYDAFFETNANGQLVRGPFDLFGSTYISNDPEGLTVDPATGRVWVSLESRGGGPDGIFEINPIDGTVLNHINVGPAWALGFNPNSKKIFFADQDGVIKEVAPDGTGLSEAFNPGVGPIFGMAFTPTGDLVLLEFAAPNYSMPPPSRLLLYDSSDDADNVFTTFPPVTITVNPYSEEYVVMVGNAYDWPDLDDTSSGKLFYIPVNPDGTFGNVSEVADLGYRAGAGIADFDNDGDLDFVAGATVELGPERALANFYLFENLGDGNFAQYLIASNVDAGVTSDNRVGTFAVADFNEDGYKDFVVPICKSDHVYLFTNNGNKTFTLTTLNPLSDPSDAKEGDFDEDEHMDFVVSDYWNRKVYLYKGNGSGAFTVQPLIDVAGGHRATDITVGDFDEDGHLDVIVDDFTPHGGGTHLHTGKIENGNLDFVYKGVVFSRPLLVGSTLYDNVYGVDSFDFDKDGHRDLILSTYEYPPAGLVFIMRGKGNGTFWPAEQIPTPPIGALGSVFPVTPSEIVIVAITIDIKPGSYPNSINLGSKGVVPVAVLTTTDFDASSVDPATVFFAGTSPIRWAMEDVDSDGDLDMIFHFDTQILAELAELNADSTEATLTGNTTEGWPIKGTDKVNIVPKKK